MILRFIIKSLRDDNYYCGEDAFAMWDRDMFAAKRFRSHQEALKLVSNLEEGMYKIEEVYVVEPKNP